MLISDRLNMKKTNKNKKHGLRYPREKEKKKYDRDEWRLTTEHFTKS